ncbi:MAG: VIT1/CCC1 transporter family protein [Bacteroidales bacterium]|nr:VIT1/CCC1 transporter family protein [Bacteroidales bacterium]
MDKAKKKIFLAQQQAEITEYYVYKRLSEFSRDEENKKTLQKIADDEMRHYHIWKNITEEDPKPKMWKVRYYVFLARFFGLSFALKLMESGEIHAQEFYQEVGVDYPDVGKIFNDEEEHEKELLNILNDKRLAYVGAVVLGLNDALVELTGTLVGLAFAFNDNLVIGVTGLIMGVAAALSMAASGYLASQEQEEQEDVNPITAAVYTGVSYLVTVVLLVFPYFVLSTARSATILMLVITILIIAGYNYYISVAKQVSFRQRFVSMTLIALVVGVITFAIGYMAKHFLGVSI